MANSYKDIIIAPNRSSSSTDPTIDFRGGDTTSNTQIILRVYPQTNGTLSFEGSAGQLFSITNDLTGTIFSVNDVSGIPSLEIDADGEVRLAEFGGNVLIGGTATFKTYRESVTTATISTTSYTVDLSVSNIFELTLGNSPVTFTFSNPPAAGTLMSFTLILKQDATGNRTVVYPASAKFTDSVTPVLATGANKIDVIQFFTVDGGTTYIGGHSMANV